MNRPPWKRNKSRGKRNSGSTSARRRAAPRPRLQQMRWVIVLLVGFSLVQYVNTGAVSWPGRVFDTVTGNLQDYAGRPAAGWRKATDSLEKIGGRKQGQPVPEFDLVGRVVRVADGDTVSVLDGSNKQHKVRLYGIDTPERDQTHGKTSSVALARLVDDKTVGVVIVDTDEYGRTVGTLYQGGTNINAAMVASGDAWWYRHYAPHNRLLADAEQRARAQGIGLWAEAAPVPPWEWRRSRR